EDPPTLTRRRRESLMNVISKEGADHLAEQAMEENQKGAELLTKVNITDLSLIDSLRYRSHFDDLYISLALSAIENYNFVKRNRRANLVHRDVAAMLFYRKNYGEAEKHLYIVCEQYVQDGWRSLELDIRSDLAHCQRRCGHYQKYIESCTTLITKACPLPHEEKAPIKGRYECIELIACMGNLQMRHIYDYLDIEYTISVDSSQINLSLAPDIPEKSIYLSGILQYIPLTINTHDGDMLDGTLTFMPSEGLLIEAVRDDRGLMYPASAPDEG
ncbi:hypothetical protein SARC_12531, partial [Sphaeroforma arctica JP610]